VASSLAVAVLPIAAASAAAPPKRFFGVDPQGPVDRADYTRMGDAGVGTIRFQLSWALVDAGPPAGDYNWSSPDVIVAGAAANGVRALPFVLDTPAWVLALDGHSCEPGSCPAYPPQGRRALAAWRAFLAAAVDRYGPHGSFWAANPDLPRLPIRAWQIWNEENSPSYWEPRPRVREYAELLDAAHEAIRERDPAATVILGGMFGTPFGGLRPGIAAWDFLARLYRLNGAKRDFEAVAPHPYAARFAEVKAQINRFREQMVDAGDGRAELWITELGWASGGTPHPLNRGLAGQARRLRQSFRYLIDKRRRLGVRNVTWYSWRDNRATDAGLCVWCPQSGLLYENHSGKPAFDAFREFTGAR
jgi:hypothetical protein